MLRVSKWNALFIFIICIFSIYFAIPSLYQNLSKNIIQYFPNNRINLGLDLRGGASILLEIDIKEYRKDYFQQYLDEISNKLRTSNIAYEQLILKEQDIELKLLREDHIQQACITIKNILGKNVQIKTKQNLITIILEPRLLKSLEKNLILQTIETIRRRVDETGTKEIDLQQQGENKILLQVPGVTNPEQIIRLLGKTAKLTFHLVNPEVNLNTIHNTLPLGYMILPIENKNSDIDEFLVLQSRALILGDMLTDAQVSIDEMGKPGVSFKLNQTGGKIFADVSSKNIGKPLAIVLDEKVISAPIINSAIISGSGLISGSFSIESANELALLLRAGSLPAPLKIVEERVVGPSLGVDSIEAGVKAVLIGVLSVIFVMVLFYGIFGIVANIALVMNIFMIISSLALLEATLTLPGIAGIVLTLGMAVDANVLICERIREEHRKGKSNIAAIESGYKMAFVTILDSNITTIAAAMILYIFGTGPIKGFAISLAIGIICSMFTAISLTKMLTALWHKLLRPEKLYL